MVKEYFRSLYQSTMKRAYETAYGHVTSSIDPSSIILDCGASSGGTFDVLSKRCLIPSTHYQGVEWNPRCAEQGRQRGLNIVQADLNQGIPHEDAAFSCVYALSLLEHLLNPCRFLKDCHRVLRPGGRLVLLTPNISTYFTAALILAGRMPSSGPHPDSESLLARQELFKVSNESLVPDPENETPVHRHLVVFSFSVLREHLRAIGFSVAAADGFGLYPFPDFAQPFLERLDPWHCHQMVFLAVKPADGTPTTSG